MISRYRLSFILCPKHGKAMHVNLTQNDNIKTFDEVVRHVELKKDRLLAKKPHRGAYLIESSSYKASGWKRKRAKGGVPGHGKKTGPPHKKAKKVQRKRGKRGGKKDKA